MDFDLELVNASLEKAQTEEVLKWALKAFPDEIAMSSSFQSQSLPLLHIVANTLPQLPILFLDTGYHFPDTIAYRDHLTQIWDLNLVILRAEPGQDDSVHQGSRPLYLTNPDLCCSLHKVAPMRSAVARYRAWISGIRRDQAASRANARVVEVMEDRRIRIHPMLNWTQQDIQRYIEEHKLPEHPLSARGYTSIGCAPCTRPPLPGGDLRSGRWTGTGKTECGLHSTLRDSATEIKK